MTFGTTVLGSGMAMVTGADSPQNLWIVLGIGVFVTIMFASTGFKIIIKK